MKRLGLYTTGMLSLLIGCSRQHTTHLTMSPHHTARPSVHTSVKISEAAESISESLVALASIQKTATPPKHKTLTDPNIYDMQGIASIDWSGPIEPLVRQIANASHYRMRVLGKAPAIPIILTIRADRQPLAQILRNIDYMAGKKANIAIDPAKKIIELRYAAA